MINIPSFITVTDTTGPGGLAAEYVVANEATGRHFAANLTTIRFIDALRRTGDSAAAAREAGILAPHANALLAQFRSFGIVAGGESAGAAPKRPPPESRLISFRIDLLNAAGLARRLDLAGRLMFSRTGLALWSVTGFAAILAVLRNPDKAKAGVAPPPDAGVGHILAFLALFAGLKLIHELGHILAYRVFCLRAGLDPGPIRAGLMVFAATPFPYTDVSGAWRLKSRLSRAAIGAGGIYLEVFAVSLLALFWATTSPGPLHTLILQVAVFSGAMTLLFNLNPAVKLDGYYIVTDLLRQPNLAGRASLAARSWAVRRLGAGVEPPKTGELAYWLISYVYRWTIFAGVFWIVWRFDPRLAPVILVVSALLLVLRPLHATLGFARRRGAARVRIAMAGFLAGAVILAGFIPLPARLLLDGQLLRYRTEFVRPPQPALLIMASEADGRLRFTSPDLTQAREDLRLRREILVNLDKSLSRNAAEKAAFQEDIANIRKLEAEHDARLAALEPAAPPDAVWTPWSAARLRGAWVSPDTKEPVGAVSRPDGAYLRLTLEQDRLERDLVAGAKPALRARLISDPDCEFGATRTIPPATGVIRRGALTLEARPSGRLPECALKARSGAALVARLPLPPKTLFEQAHSLISRMLQNRLPMEHELTR